MQKKINILITTAIATLLALISIQAYLIYNTYELKKDVFLKETKRAIGRIDDESEMVVATNELWAQGFMELLWQYRFEELDREKFIAGISNNTDSLNSRYNTLYKEELKKTNLGYDIKFKKNIYSIIILDSIANDTVFPRNEETHLFMLGEDFKESEGYDVSQARWETDYSQLVDGDEKLMEFRVLTRDRMNISDWKRIVLGRMAVLLTGSVLLLLFVVGLFYYSIKNLIKQKKVAEVKTDFINNITHELKTPLATLAIASKSLRKKEILQNPQTFQNTLGILERQNDRLQKLIDQVTTNSLGSSALVLHKEQVIDNSYFKNVLDDFELSVQSNDFNVVRNIEQREVVLRLDTFLFTTALFNMLENAIKYSKAPVVLTVGTQLKNNEYEINIGDNGVGIKEKDLKHLFDKFYRVESGNIHNVKGLGLGLYYSKQVIDAHSGTITVASKPGSGTTFTITIPVN